MIAPPSRPTNRGDRRAKPATPVAPPARRDQLSALIRRYQRDTDAFDQALAERLRINRTDLRCLDLILEGLMAGGAVTPTQLASASGLNGSTITSILDRLETAGYVRRVRDQQNRRQVLIEFTPVSVALTGEIFGSAARDAASQLARYTDQELDVLIRFFGEAHELRAAHTRRLLTTANQQRVTDREET